MQLRLLPMLPRETEIKFDLQNKKNHDKLIKFFNADDKAVEQSNSFFDTENSALSKQGWACRLRIESDRALLTLKGTGIKDERGLTTRTEIEQRLDMEEASDFIMNGITVDSLPDKFSITGPMSITPLIMILLFWR
jgi:inorganic triphosphatase YgiF